MPGLASRPFQGLERCAFFFGGGWSWCICCPRGYENVVGKLGAVSTWLCCGLLFSLGLSSNAAAQTVTYIHTDALGSVVAETDAGSGLVKRYDYEPYGAVAGGQSADGPGYAGHVSNSATGLGYMQQRYMDPHLGIFFSVDPVAAYEQASTQFNRYRYANGNPYKFIDPDGRRACGADTKCALQQGAAGGFLAVNSEAPERTEKQAASIALSATIAANKVLNSIKGKEFNTPRSAARSWNDRIRPVANKFDAEIASRLFIVEAILFLEAQLVMGLGTLSILVVLSVLRIFQ
ncbi:MAG: tRNA(Glu)-specific nuclease WapA [Stenotrophomonas maltophilia]|nr:MAG: tRNA(Glu)-specific nuclease WapA [Stenotrophomonas maltophilia]